jgi:hypothetical protein
MKRAAVIFFLFIACMVKAANPYQRYLLAKAVTVRPHSALLQNSISTAPASISQIPRYQIPKGNVFCRMEDKLTKTTGVWIKVGVK